MNLKHTLRTLLGYEPLVLYGEVGTDKERATKICIEKYRGWDICYYYGKGYRYHDTSTIFSSPSSSPFMVGSQTSSEWVGNGIFVGSFNDSFGEGDLTLTSYWIRISIDRIGMKFENSPEKVKIKFDEAISDIKRGIDKFIRRDEQQNVQQVIKENHHVELERAIKEGKN